MPTFAEIATLSPLIVIAWLVLLFAERVIVPLFVKHLWPQWSKQAKARLEAERKADEETERERRRREDRLYEILEANTRVMSNLQGTLERMSAQLGQQSEVIHDLALDVSGLYGHLQTPRPSRRREKAEASASDR